MSKAAVTTDTPNERPAPPNAQTRMHEQIATATDHSPQADQPNDHGSDAQAMGPLQLSRPSSKRAISRLSLHISERRLLLLLGDATSWFIVITASTFFLGVPRLLIMGLSGAAVLWSMLAWVNGAYDVEAAGRPSVILPTIARTAVGVLLCLTGVAFLAHGSVGRADWAMSLVLSLTLIVLWRVAYLNLFSLRVFSRRLLFAGVEPLSGQLADLIRDNWSAQLAVVGFLGRGVTTHDHAKVLAEVDQALVTATALGVSEIVASPQTIEDPLNSTCLVDCTNAGFKVTPSPLLYEELLRRVPVTDVDPRWVLDVARGAFADRAFLGVKRLFDLVFASVGLFALTVLLPLAVLAIISESGGPVFYRQERVGLRGRTFTITKFRTMYQNAEVANGAVWAQPGDRRVTRVGRFLRRSRIDELPQFLNILRGEMSAVGPRPERPEFVKRLAGEIPYYCTRHAVKPGLTGWAQINYGYGASVHDSRTKLEYDLYYVRHQSFLLDTLIILRTIGIVLRLGGQ